MIPEGLGGRITLKCVCPKCNTDLFSPLDKELISKSPVSIVVQQELGVESAPVWVTTRSLTSLLRRTIYLALKHLHFGHSYS